MDRLLEIKIFYDENLNKRIFHIVSFYKSKIYEFDLSFDSSNLKHLLGIQHLKGIDEKNIRPNDIYEKIGSGKLVLETLKKSENYDEISERIERFEDILLCLETKNPMLRRIRKSSFNSIDADFLLINNINAPIPHLFIKNEFEITACPVSFFLDEICNYDMTSKYTIKEIAEITDNKRRIIDNSPIISIYGMYIVIKSLKEKEIKDWKKINNKIFIFEKEEYSIINLSMGKGSKIKAILERLSDKKRFIDYNFVSMPVKDFKLNLVEEK